MENNKFRMIDGVAVPDWKPPEVVIKLRWAESHDGILSTELADPDNAMQVAYLAHIIPGYNPGMAILDSSMSAARQVAQAHGWYCVYVNQPQN